MHEPVRKAVVVDTAGFHLAVVTDAIAAKAMARGEIARTDKDGVYQIRPGAERLAEGPGLTPEQLRRREVQRQKGRR